MIEQQGTVIAVTPGLAEVRMGPAAACAACEAGKGCGAGVFGRLLQRGPVLLQVPNGIGADTGQAVVIGIPESVFLRLLMRLYLLPLLAGFTGGALGYYLAGTHYVHSGLLDAATVAGAVIAGGLTAWMLRAVPRDLDGRLHPRLLRRVSGPGGAACGSARLVDDPCNK